MNYKIFVLINQLALKNPSVDKIMIFSSKVLPYIMAAIILITYIYGILHNNIFLRETAVATVLLIAVNLFINFVIGCFFYVPRPFVRHKVNLLLYHVKDSSFPSDHATVTMGTAVGLMRSSRILGWICVFASLLVGFSRIYVGHHYPFDVLGSYFIVILTNAIFHKFFENKVKDFYCRIEKHLIKPKMAA